MLPVKQIRLSVGTLVAGDTAALNQATNANRMILFTNNINPTENTVIGDLVEATFDGYSRITAPVGAAETGVDPATGDQRITIPVPLTGWRWVTTGTTGLPQTIYGFALVDKLFANLWCIEKLVEPITLGAVGQEINIGKAQIDIVQQPMS